MSHGLNEKTLTKIKNVFTHYSQIETAILYGSRAKGTHKNGSDIDFTLTGQSLSLSIINKIRNDLDELLLPYSFDISIHHQINNPDLLQHIERIGIIFYKKNRMNPY